MPIVTIQAENGQRIEEMTQYTGGGGLMPKGVYQFLIDSCANNEASGSGKHPWSRVTATVTGILESSVEPSQQSSLMGRESSEIFSWSPKALGAMRALVVAAGIQYRVVDYQGGIQGLEFDTDHLIGKTIEVKIIHQDDDRENAKYKTQSRWVDIQRPGTFAAGKGGAHAAGQPSAQGPQGFVPGGFPAQQPQQAPQGFVPQGQPPQGFPQQPAQPMMAPQQLTQQPMAQPQGWPQQPQGQQGYFPQGGSPPPR